MIKNQKNRRIIQEILKRVIALVLVFCMVFGDSSVASLIAYATERSTNPQINVSWVKQSGGEDTNVVNTTLLANNTPMNVAAYVEPLFSDGTANEPYVTVQLPFLYMDDNGVVHTASIESDVPPDKRGLIGVRARIVNDADYSVVNHEKETTSADGRFTYYEGSLTLKLKSGVLTEGNPHSIVFEIGFYGENIPENTSAVLKVGGGYENFTDSFDVTTEDGFHVDPGKGVNSTYTIINSSLRWELEYKQVGEQTLWDKYNYMTYEVTIKNTSDSDSTSYFDKFAINIEVPCDEIPGSTGGLLNKDAMAWIYDRETGNITQNPNTTFSDNHYIGKPQQGGILIYDITGKSNDVVSEINLETYMNAEEVLGTQSIPYSFTNTFLLNIPVDEAVHVGQEKKYYIAVPFTNNFQGNAYENIHTVFYPTVYLGTDVQWSKTYDMNAHFLAPDPNFTHEKYVLDDAGNKIFDYDTNSDGVIDINAKEVGLGDTVQYYIGGLENTGNLPAFNTVITDTLPEKFDLTKITIQMDLEVDDDPTDTVVPAPPEITEWFWKDKNKDDTDDDILEFGFTDLNGDVQWVSLGSFTEVIPPADPTAPDPTVREWSVNLKDRIKAYLTANPGYTFTYQMRFNLAERIDEKLPFEGRIIVEGVTDELALYTNTIHTEYDMKLYSPSVIGDGGDQYYEIPQVIEKDASASVETQPAVPTIQTVGYRTKKDGTFVWGNQSKNPDETNVPLRYPGVGIRYELGNDSISPVVPGVFSSGDLLNTTTGRGLAIDKIVISKDLVACSQIDYINIGGYTVNLSAADVDTDGNYVIDESVWEYHVSNVYYVKIVFEEFDKNIMIDSDMVDDVYILLEGETTVLGDIPITGTFETQYGDPNYDTVASDGSILKVTTIDPYLTSQSYNSNTNEFSGVYSSSSTGTLPYLPVPYNTDGTGFIFNIVNRAESAAGETNVWIDFTQTGVKNDPSSSTKIVKGFVPQDITISKTLDQIGTIDKIEFYDWDQDPTVSTTIPELTIPWDDIKTNIDTNGDYYVSQSQLTSASTMERIKTIKIVFSDYGGQADLTNPQTLKITVDGVSEQWDNIDAELTFEPLEETMSDKIVDVTARLSTIKPDVTVAGYSYNETAESGKNPTTSFQYLTVPNEKEDTGYVFEISNATASESGPVEVLIDLPQTGVKNDTTVPGAIDIVRGFEIQDIYFGNVDAIGTIDYIEFYDYDEEPTDPSATKYTVPWSTLTFDPATGQYQIPQTVIDGMGMTQVNAFRVVFTNINGKSATTTAPLTIKIDGRTNWFGDLDAKLSAELKDETMYKWSDEDKKTGVSARLHVQKPNLKLKVHSYAANDGTNSAENVSTAPNTINSVTVPNKVDNKGYVFKIFNESTSDTGTADVLIDFTETGIKNDTTGSADPIVKGFDLQDIYFSANTETIGDIAKIEFYDYDQDPSKDAAEHTIIWDSLTPDATDGRYHIAIDPDTLEDEGITRIKYMRIVFSDIYGKPAAEQGKPETQMEIQLDGVTDWFDNLDAKMTATLTDETIYTWTDLVKNVTGRLKVDRPSLMVHTNIYYYENTDETSHSTANSTIKSSDGYLTRLGIPYDRDFLYKVSIENLSISILDDVDVKVELPINDNEQGEEANTGFHTTKVEIHQEFVNQFAEFESFTIYDRDSTDGITFEYDATDNKFVCATDSTLTIESVDNKWTFVPSDLSIDNLHRMEFTGDKVKLKDENTADAWVKYYGYSDSLFGTENTIFAEADNYLDGIREERYKIHTQDRSISTVSKMYFDTVLAAGYKDIEATLPTDLESTRFDQTSSAVEHVRDYYVCTHRYSACYFYDDSELDVGYKAIGSYMLDFRQYLNAGSNLPDSYPYNKHRITEYDQEHYNMGWIYTQSFNTKANIEMTMTLPTEYFDAYYVKVRSDALSYLQSITVYRADGTFATHQAADWAIPDSIETYNGQDYYLIPLVPTGTDTYGLYKSPKDYGTPTNPVEKVVFNLNINEDASKDGVNAANPDFGTGYHAQTESTKYMFEVTGRFYKTNTYRTNSAEAKVSTTMTVGDGIRSKLRVDSGANNEKSDWSYYNRYCAYTGGNWHIEEDTARHLVSTARVFVHHDNNRALKGVQGTITANTVTQEENRSLEFGSRYEYPISFYRQTAAYGHDYESGHDYTSWYYEDPDDWSGKLSYADEVYLDDTLPQIQADATYGYIGFVTQDIQISQRLYQYMDTIVFKLSDNTTQTLTKDELLASTTASGYYEAIITYQGETLTSQSNEILLPTGTFVKSFRVTLKDLPGSADYARELFGNQELLQADFHNDSTTVDMKVGGQVQSVNQLHADAYGLNTISTSFKNDDMTAEDSTYQWRAPTERASTADKALMMGYQIPFSAGWSITKTSGDPEYDYLDNNITPDNASFGVKIWNRADSDAGSGRSARLKYAKMTNSLQSGFNLKNIYIPKQLVDGNWFNVENLTLYYHGGSKSYSLADLRSSGYFALNADNTNYVFDVNAFIRNNPGLFATSSGYNNTSETYIHEYISRFDISYRAVSPDIFNDDSLLDGGEFVSATKESGYAYTYDGVFVNRTTTDVAADTWTASSRPTFGMSPHAYNGVRFTNSISANATYFETADLNAKPANTFTQNGSTGDDSTSWYVYNRVGKMVVKLDRGTTLDDGTFTFAYDKNTVTNDDGTKTTTEHKVDKYHIIPYDYIDYTLTVGAAFDSVIPLQHTDLRFVAPAGMRIVGWKIASNDTSIPNDEITAKAGATTLLPNNYYVESGGLATNYKTIDFSLGSNDGGDDDQIFKNQKIKIIVYTQMTQEVASYEGKNITAYYYATSNPKHTYSQYSIYALDGSGNNAGDGTSSNYYTDDSSSETYQTYYRTGFDFNTSNTTAYTEYNYISQVSTRVTFRTMVDNLYLEYLYDDTTSQYDRQPMTIKVYGKNSSNAKINLINDTYHTLETATYEVSFMDGAYKNFELTERPNIDYPSNIADSAKKAEIFYWVTKADGTEEWVESQYFLTADETVPEDGKTYYRLADAKKVRWVYRNIPEIGTDGNAVTFATTTAPIRFKGLGLYNDVRPAGSTDAMADRYTMKLSATSKLVHHHIDEDGNGKVDGTVTYTGSGSVSTIIARERPIITYQSQVFSTEAEAAATYAHNRTQKNAYRPGDTMWYKVTVQNRKLTTASEAQSGMQGVMLNPTFYDKVPEYVTPAFCSANNGVIDSSKIQIRWYDISGNRKTAEEAKLKVELSSEVEAPDYFGDMIANKQTVTAYADNSPFSGHAFGDIIPSSSNSVVTDYDIYKFSFDGGARLEAGDRIEIWYQATVREEDLPMAYVKDGTNVYPEFFPKIGEYYQHGRHGALPVVSAYMYAWWSVANTDNNSDIMMDMNYLIHDVGITGTPNKDVEKWEFLNGATTYIPGYSGSEHNGYDGDNSRLMDYDSASGQSLMWQAVTYIPAKGTGENDLPSPEHTVYRNYYSNRDYYEYVVEPRTRWDSSNWDNLDNASVLAQAILWSETRTHLQTAWLATSAEIIPDVGSGEAYSVAAKGQIEQAAYIAYGDHAREYLDNAFTNGKTNPDHYYSYSYEEYQDFFADDYIPTLEYDESYTARLGAYNYGDWSLDGVEFTYVLPAGTSPVMGADGKPIVAGHTLTGGDSMNPAYTQIAAENIEVTVVQDPDSYAGYLSPRSVQDPLLIQSAYNSTTDKTTTPYYDASAETSWVLKIVVKQPLNKWFNRGGGKGYILLVDVRCHVDENMESDYWYDQVIVKPWEDTSDGSKDSLYYQIYDITSWQGDTKVKSYQNGSSLSVQYGGMDYLWEGWNLNGTWDGLVAYINGSPNMPYINGYNIQNKEIFVDDANKNGVTASGNLKEVYSSGNSGTYASTGTRAHMRKPFIRTWTTMGTNPNGSNLSEYYLEVESDRSQMNIHVENKYYWNDYSVNGYFYNYDYSAHSGHDYVRHAHNYSTNGGNEGTLFYPVVTNILPEGVVPMYEVTDEEGNVVSCEPFTATAVATGKTLSWKLYNNSNAEIAGEKALYTAEVEIIQLAVVGDDGNPVMDEDGNAVTEERYKITFYSDSKDTKIVSRDRRVFSFDIITVEEPDITTKTGGINNDLLMQYQTNNIYVTSQLDGFEFIVDNDIGSNPFTVGQVWNPYWGNAYVGDGRLDSIRRSILKPGYSNYPQNYLSGGVLPNSTISILGTTYSIIDAREDGGILRYKETNTSLPNRYADIGNLEDYTNIRNRVILDSVHRDFNLSGSLEHTDATLGTIAETGVTTSMRIRIKHPRITLTASVSQTLDNVGVTDDTSVKGITHYPTAGFDNKGYIKSDADHKQYGDELWYTATIGNKPASTTDYSHMGDVKHAKIVVSMVLPSNVTYKDEYYIEKTAADGTVQRFSMEQLKEEGWTINLRETYIDPTTNEETHIFEIITPGEATSYDEYMQGVKRAPGYFATGDEFKFRIRTVIDSLEEPDTVLADADYWDEEYYADMYVTLEDSDGSYLKNFTDKDKLKAQTLGKTEFTAEVKESAATDTDAAVDYDLDDEFDERFASSTTARVTVLKPSAEVRLDTSIKRVQINNPDAGIIIAEDASIKGATISNIYLDQAINTGGAVGEFIVDYRVPHRGTHGGTIYEAEAPDPALITNVSQIRTGVWEVPQMTDTAYYEALCNNLKVNIYVRVVDGPENVAYDNPGALNEYNTEGNWHSLGSYGLTENKVIEIDDDWQTKIRQVRFVIKAGDTGDIVESQKYPVPQGFRLDIDADTRTADVDEEMDMIDPNRANVELSADKAVPNNVADNAAFITVTMKHQDPTNGKIHVNYFATAWSRYDDVQYSVLSDPARAGYYLNTELPVIQKDLIPYYFHRFVKEDESIGFEWSNTDLLINNSFSTMLKYTSVLKNLSDEQIDAIENVEIKERQDNASRPTISVVLPYIQDIDDANFQYVDAYSSAYDSAYVNSAYTSSKRLTQTQAQWTYYVVDEEGNVVTKHRLKSTDSDKPDFTFRTYEKHVDLSGQERKVLTWEFEGYLEPGQSLVVEYMVPINTKDYGIVSNNLMTCSSHGFLAGSFKQYIPESTSTNETYSIDVDTRDVNENGKTISETALIKRVGGIAFDTDRVVNRLKYSYSEYDTAGLQVSRPALVPEGTDYSFKSAAVNPDIQGADGFTRTVIYDVLPHVNDRYLVSEDNEDPTLGEERNSKWSGWVIPESIEVLMMKASRTGTETVELIDGEDCEIWVGPFTIDAATNQIVAGTVDDLPEFTLTEDMYFYIDAYADESMRRQYFVKLSELMAASNASELAKDIMAIWVQVDDEKELQMSGSSKYELNYSLHSPLNLPQYQGAVTSDMDDDAIRMSVADSTGWNTFSVQTNNAMDAQNPLGASESPQAGVYLNAPVEKGYIGSYVWYDADYDTIEDEGEYERRSDGRLIFKNKTQDLDFDGVADDPGINGVLVELLSPNGYPVNKLGEPVVEVEENGVTKYILIDENTGLKAKDSNGTYLYTTEGPASFTTESDAYGNEGYYIISNVVPGDYKLRYTFPEGTYNQYALSTLEIGASGADMDIYRPGDTLPDIGNKGRGDVTCDGQLVMDRLIVQTAESITIEARGTDTSTYAAYDEKMTSYNVGVSKAYEYGGYAWVDEGADSANPFSNGIMDDNEKRLPNVEVTFYEVVNGALVPATDVSGNPAVRTTDEKGYFEIWLYPNRTYVARTSTANTDSVYKPSPITINTDPLVQKDDNDLKQTADKKHQETFLIATGIQWGADGNPIMNADGNYGLYDSIGLGYVHAGRGYIGKYVWDDKNYDGIRNSYTNEGAVVSEPGIGDVKLILEKFYYDPEATDEEGNVVGAWIPVTNETRTEVSNAGGSYTFQNVSTTYTANDADGKPRIYLAGYKVSVDLDSIKALPTRYAITKFFMNGGLDDSDLPVTATTGNSYLQVADSSDMDSQGMIIMAELATDSTSADYIISHEDKDYDVTEGKMLLDLDLGLTVKEYGYINGKVWDDKSYDGLQNQYSDTPDTMADEPGVAGVELEAIQYYREDGKWVQKTDFVSPVITTDANGNYSVALDTYVTIGEENYLASYQIRVKGIDGKYAVTKYKVGKDTTIDSNLIDENLYLTEKDEYLILADKVADTAYGKDKEYIIINDLGNFDINKSEVISGYDAGLVEYQKASLSGKIWDDLNYNGVYDYYEVVAGDEPAQSVHEPGIAGTNVTLHQYYLDADGNWQTAPAWTPQTITTDANGDYTFANVDTHVVVEGKHYLAGYKVMVDPLSAPDKTSYGITIYRVAVTDEVRNSDLTNDYEIYHGDDYTILAAPVVGKVQNTPYLEEVEGVVYDYVTAKDNPNNDGGFTKYQTSTIRGNVFEDEDYDGLYDSEENFADILAALDVAAGENLIVTMTTWYLAPGVDEEGNVTEPVWQPYMVVDAASGSSVQETRTAVVNADALDAIEDGSYVFENVPTQVSVVNQETQGVTHYLAGYKLTINKIPNGFGTTLYLENAGVGDSSLYYEAATESSAEVLDITKTHPADGYAGTTAEEMDGYLIAAKPVEEGKSGTFAVVENYDLLGGRTLSDYNAGYHKEGTGEISGTVFHDPNYDGIYEMDTEDGINNVTVYLDQYYLKDGTWNRADDGAYTQTLTTTVGAEDGIFKFESLPAKVVINGIAYLASYRIRLGDLPEGYAVTKFNQRTDAGDALDETRDSDMLSDNHELILGDGSDPLDGYIVTAQPLAADAVRNEEYIREYNGVEYDLQQSVSVNDYDAGLVDYQAGSIGGLIWMDNSENDETNYNGIQDEDEPGIEGQKVLLTQYAWDGDEWILVEDFAMEDVTDENGEYLFSDLPVFRVTDEGERQLLSYQLQVEELLEGHAVTKYRQGEDGTKDSDLEQATLRLTTEDEFIILAEDVTEDTYRNADYVIPVKTGLFEDLIYYDIVVGNHNRDYDVGYTPFMDGSISGLIWMDYRDKASADDESTLEETNYNGIQDEGEAGIPDQKVLLSQYVLIDNKWELVEDFSAESVTDEKGLYHFDNLPVFRKTDEGKYQLYSYRLKVEELLEGAAVTKYRQGEDTTLDSDLDVETLELTTEEEFIVLAIDVTDDDYRNEAYVVEVQTGGIFSDSKFYDLVGGVDNTDYDGGYRTFTPGSISGLIWMDTDYNGIQDEGEVGIEGQKVLLSQYVWNNDEWELVEDFSAEAVTDETGLYQFDNLPVFTETEEAGYQLYSYKLNVEELMPGVAVTKYRQGEDAALDSDLNAETLELTTEEEFIVLAVDVTDDDYRNETYVIKVKTGLFSPAKYYDFAGGVDNTDYDGGYTEYPLGSIEGIAFEDGDKDGLYGEEKDKLRAGMTIYLKQYYYNTETEEWTEVSEGYEAETVTDKDGAYRFENLPTYVEVEEEWYLCGYKLWLKEMPSGYQAAEYQKNDGDDDSALVADTLQIVKGDERLAEMQDGYIVIALNNSEDDYRNMSNTIGDYDIAAASHLTDYNVGIAEKPVDTGDHSRPIMWFIILLISGSAIMYEGVYRRRRRIRK